MNTKPVLAAAFAALLLSSCDNGQIYGLNTATVAATITPWRGLYDSVVIDVRSGSFRGPLRESNHDPMHDPDQSLIYIDDLPRGDWVFAAVYYKTYWKKTGATDSVPAGTAHRVAVAQGSVEAVYYQDCDCRKLAGDDINLSLSK